MSEVVRITNAVIAVYRLNTLRPAHMPDSGRSKLIFYNARDAHYLSIRHSERGIEPGREVSMGSLVDCFTHRRSLDSIGHVSPAEFEKGTIVSCG